MAEQLNKLQIKAEILTVLSSLRASFDSIAAENALVTLKEQEDKQSVLDILIKELTKADEQKVIIICFILVKLFEQKVVEDEFWKLLKGNKTSDITKTILLNMLKDMGNKIEYETIEQCFDNPEEVIDEDTKRLLQNAVINPEAQIDFLDFLNSLPEVDKKILIESLGEDYASDNLANILNPVVLYEPDSTIAQVAIDILGETKSQLALYTLKEVSKYEIDEVTKVLVKKNISKLKLAGIRDENAIEFYKSVLDSKPYDCYASYPDGHGNQAIIFSREREDEYIQMLAVVINDTYGIIDCFGFNQISRNEFERIVNKFYNNDERIYLDSHVIKTLLENAEKITRRNGGIISYEYICWKTILSDITPEVSPIEITLSAKYDKNELTKDETEKILMLDFIQKWFFDGNDNSEFGKIINELNEKIQKNEFSFNFNQIVENSIENIFSNTQKTLLDKRILICAYLDFLTGKNIEAQSLYSLYFDENAKLELQKNILRKSFYEYYVALKFKLKEENKMTNIFAMRNRKKTIELNTKQLETVISIIEGLWVNA